MQNCIVLAMNKGMFYSQKLPIKNPVLPKHGGTALWVQGPQAPDRAVVPISPLTSALDETDGFIARIEGLILQGSPFFLPRCPHGFGFTPSFTEKQCKNSNMFQGRFHRATSKELSRFSTNHFPLYWTLLLAQQKVQTPQSTKPIQGPQLYEWMLESSMPYTLWLPKFCTLPPSHFHALGATRFTTTGGKETWKRGGKERMIQIWAQHAKCIAVALLHLQSLPAAKTFRDKAKGQSLN